MKGVGPWIWAGGGGVVCWEVEMQNNGVTIKMRNSV